MDSATSRTGKVPAWARVALGLLLASAFLPAVEGEAVAQWPSPTYAKKGTWAETLAALRVQVAGRPRLFLPQPGFPFQRPDRSEAPPPHPLVTMWTQLERDFPLECDWMLQDLAACGYPCGNPARPDQYPIRWFGPRAGTDLEKTLLLHVIEELGGRGRRFKTGMAKLERNKTPSHTQPWLELYAAACRIRRQDRLATLAAKCPAFVFTKHFNMGGSHYAFTEALSDAQSERHFVPGSSLCLLEMKNGSPVVETLLDDSTGVIRDPDVSYDGKGILFAWKKSDRLDDYHLYELELASGKVRQITFGLGFADYEGVFLPDGDILFNSSRCVQSVDCFFTEVSNLYTCDRDGRFLRRLGFDQVHSNYPTLAEDGRVIYTRWEYNDRGQIYTQALFQMNPDGTGQTECYGNNSYFPTAILHAREIPGTQKVVAIASGHHCQQMGKLIVLDRTRGLQENQGAQLVAPVRPTPAVMVDRYGQFGELFQYPYPLSETEFLVSYSPWGRSRDPLLFGIYWVTADGRRELLVSDPDVSCNQPVPLHRPTPHRRPSTTDYAQQTGTYYIQDVYAGPGLAGVPKGKAKKLRVIGLDFRATVIGGNHNRGEAGAAFVATPIAVAQGSWQAKTVLGEAPISDDGSAYFTAPARMPLYFQVIDEKGCAIQTMRSWTTLQPGENGSCVGCHENKSDSPMAIPMSEALGRGPRPLKPFYGPPRGFSFAQEIQPILDRHCTSCHHDRSGLAWLADTRSPSTSAPSDADSDVSFSLLANATVDRVARRRFSDAYLALTGAVWGYDQSLEGTSRPLVNWISPQSGPPMRKPYSAGSATSSLMTLLEEGHKGVRLDREETEKLACWIDLVVPYCGDYQEANAWWPFERFRYNRFLTKRKKMEAVEAGNIRQLMASRGGKEETGTAADAEPTPATSLAVEIDSDDGKILLEQRGSATVESPLLAEVPRPLRPGDRISVRGVQHLAVQLDAKLGEQLIYARDGQFSWTVPAEAAEDAKAKDAKEKTPYFPDAFRSPRPQLSFRPVTLAQLDAYRNLAANPYDLQEAARTFPHATASGYYGNDSVFAPRNAIDSQRQNDRHGGWPGQSWGPDKVEKPWWQIDFGRLVEIDKVVIVLRADFPHDSYWRQATLVFSDGHRESIELEKKSEPQRFTFEARRTSSLRLADLVQDEPLGWCALTEVEVWGRDLIGVAEDLSVLAP